ncbi:hypothetical protein BpHYR1_009623 [Brachionus plicatilis]|uniref:Uncharacterized protein n=1 Tax=Brachionus plicatilis TaxID=10195 RepID=A0A3M7SQZ4_BRAPC|nr:hypothetical protein BpHYR1_009623 [Brachionus plicatilis]
MFTKSAQRGLALTTSYRVYFQGPVEEHRYQYLDPSLHNPDYGHNFHKLALTGHNFEHGEIFY